MLTANKITPIRTPTDSNSSIKTETSPTSVNASPGYGSTSSLLSLLKISPDQLVRSRSTSTPSFPLLEENATKQALSAKYLNDKSSFILKKIESDANLTNKLTEQTPALDDEIIECDLTSEDNEMIFDMDL